MFKVRRGSSEEIPLIQAKEQRLRFAGAGEEIPHVQGEMAVQAQEGREELFHFQAQEGQR